MSDKIHTFRLFHLVVYFVYQSHVFDLSQWISLITLCFAPLIAHVLAGVPTTTQLSLSSPRWHDRLPLYHPTSIVWRYMTIIDRIIRAKSWDAADLAAVNAMFWTSHGWDGTEEMAVRTRATLTRIPRKSKFRKLASSSTMNTLVTSLQGVQAIYLLCNTYKAAVTDSFYSLNNVFIFVAMFGLLRLPAAPWITDDYGYACEEPAGSDHPSMTSNEDTSTLLPPSQRLYLSPMNHSNDSRYSPVKWKSTLIRLGFVLSMIAIALYTIFTSIIPFAIATGSTTSSEVVTPMMYFFLAVPLAIILATYGFRTSEKGKTTILPCASAAWYKAYTFLWFLWALFAVIVSSLETGMSPCGTYTTIPRVLYPAGYICPQ